MRRPRLLAGLFLIAPTHRIWCSACTTRTPHACRPDLDVPEGAPGLAWECVRCGRQAYRRPEIILTSERLTPERTEP